MKILHVVPSISPVRGGTSRAVLDTVLALQQAGIQADIATTNDNGPTLMPVPLRQRVEHEQVPVYFFPKLATGPFVLQEFNFSPSLTQWLWQNVARYDLVHVHMMFSYPATAAMRIAQLKGVPYINTPHGLLCRWSLQQSAVKKRWFMRLFERTNLGNAQAIHVTAPKEQEELSDLNLADSESFVLPLGLYMPKKFPQAAEKLRASLNITDDAPIVLFLGRLHYKKGLDYLIPALGRLKHLPFHFVLAGSGDAEYDQVIESLLQTADIKDRTHCLGFVSGEQKDIVLQGSDLFALTSHSENFGIAVLEALAAGVPVLLTPGVALAQMVSQHQIGYVPQLEIDDICEALSDAIAHPEKNAEMGRKAQQLIQSQFTWEEMAQQLIQQYDSILQSSKYSLPNPAPTVVYSSSL